MKTVLKYLNGFYLRMTLGFVIKTLGTVSELMLPLILSHILKNVIGENVSQIVVWGSAMIGFSFLACILNIVANRMAANVSRRFARNLRRDLFYKTLTLSAKKTDEFTIPSLESRITTDTYHVHGFIGMVQRMGVRSPILLIGGICITLMMDATLSLVMIFMLPFIFLTILFISKKGVPLYTKVQKSVDSMVRVVREDVQGIRVIKALSKVDYEHRRYDNVNKNLVNDEKRAGITMGLVNPVMTLFMNMGSVFVVAIGANRVFNHSSDPETLIAFMQYFTQISMAMVFVTRMFMMYTKASASARRIEEVLLCEDDIRVMSKDDYPDIRTDAFIKFQDVSFSYLGKRQDLSNINFELKKGESLGIIGATGAGKSTLIYLLMRFYDVDKGNIYINGEDVRTIEKERLCEMFGVSMQYDFLYGDTIEENIKFGREATDEEIRRAAEISQADDFICDFSEGYQRVLSQHGTNISGGQKQRILITRAILKNPAILILDDSSSALDYKTDAALRKALKENLCGTTVVTVAQRVSSVKESDHIIVIDEGRIIGIGNHAYLMDNCSEYKEISDSQMGGAFVE